MTAGMGAEQQQLVRAILEEQVAAIRKLKAPGPSSKPGSAEERELLLDGIALLQPCLARGVWQLQRLQQVCGCGRDLLTVGGHMCMSTSKGCAC